MEHIPDFWAHVWDFAGIRHSAPYTAVVDDPAKMPGAKWFSGARLNFELAVKKILDGKDPGNRDALKNPESLDFFMGLKDLIENC